MKSASVCLLDEQLRSLLEEDLLPHDAAQCEEHLASCPRCREKVESLIGDADWWQEAQDSLRSPQDRTATIPPENLGNIAPHADILRLLGPTDNPQMLGRIGSYEIVGILGRGGMGVVFKGFDAALNRFVAIKMLAPHLAASGAARKRFEREAQAAAAIVHDHVMAIHGVADWQGTPYLVMPYVRGASLQSRIDEQGPFQLREILRIGMQTAAGLAAAHAQGLVHRDIKPANIMLASGVERVALTDFGLARAVDDATLTRTGTLAGTPQYMSPEQARGQAVDFRSDLFSLGSVLYTLCTGRPPFRAETSYGILRLITDEEPRPIPQLNSDIPVWLCTLIGKLMAKNPADRFASADEVSKLLEKCLAHIEQPSLVSLPVELLPPPPAVALPTQATARSVSRRTIAIACGLLLAVIGVYFGMLVTNPPEIAGTWQGEDWGTVILKPEAAGEYAGEFSETVGNVPGQLQLKWSRIERRYNGSWKDGDQRLGDLSLRLVDQQIRGAYSTSANSKTNPATPRLADFTWTRTTPPTASNASPPTKATTLENIPIYKSSFDILFENPGIYRLSIYARRRANENPEAGPFIKELGTQVVEVLASDVSHPVALIERIRSFDKLPSKSPTYHYQLLSGTLTRSLGSQTLGEKEDSSFQTNLSLPRIVTCEHQSVTQLATYQEDGWQVQLELHVQRWASDDTTAPKEDRTRLGSNSSFTSNAASLVRTTEPEWFRPDSSPQAFLPRGGSMSAIHATGQRSYLQYITTETAAKDLGLNSTQKQEIAKVMASTSENWFKRSRQIHDLLTTEQQQQVRFELNQQFQLDIFETPEVMQRLGITRDQQAAIASRLNGLHAKRHELYYLQRNPDPSDPGPLGLSRTGRLMTEVDAIHVNAASDIYQRILTAEQAAAVNSLRSYHAIRQDVWLDGQFPCSSNQAFVQPTQNATISWSRKILMKESGIYRLTLHGQRKVLGGYSDSVRDPEFTNYGSITFASPTKDLNDFTLDFMTDTKNEHPHWRLSLSALNQGTSLHLFQGYLDPSALIETDSTPRESLTPSHTQFIQIPTIQSTIQHETLWLKFEHWEQGTPGVPKPETQNTTYQVDGSQDNFASNWHRDIPFPELPVSQASTFSNAKIDITTLLSVRNELAQLGKDVRDHKLLPELDRLEKNRPDESLEPYRSNSQGIFQSLSPSQYARINELAVQQYGCRAFLLPEIAAYLQLSKDQESAIQSAIAAYQLQLESLAKETGDSSSPENPLSLPELLKSEYRLIHNKKGRLLLLKVWQQIYDELSVRQRAQFRQLQGPVFTYPASPNFSPLQPIQYDRSNCDIAFEKPGIYRLSISSRRHEIDNPNRPPVIADLGYQVVEVQANDVGPAVARLEHLGGRDLNSGYLMASFFRLRSGTITRNLGQQTFSDKALATRRTSPTFPETITCKHDSTTPIYTYQENGWQVQLELHVQRWDLSDTTAPKEDRMRLLPSSVLTSNFLWLQDLYKTRQETKRDIGLSIPPGYITNVAIIARGKNAARVLRRFHAASQKEDSVGRLTWEVKLSEQADSFPTIQETLYVTSANQKEGEKPTTLQEEHKYIIEPRLFNPQTREKPEETKINLVVPFVGGSDLPLEVSSGETKEALLFFDVSADQIEHEIWLRVSLDPLPPNLRPQNAFHTALGSSWKALRYPRPESEVADVELSIPLFNQGYDLPLNPGLLNEDLNVQMQQLELLAPYTQGAGLDGSHDLVLQTPSGLKPEVLASTTLAFSHHTKMRIRTRPAESKNLRTLAPPTAEKITEAFSKALQGNWKCVNITETSLNVSSKLKNIESIQFAGQQMHTIALGQKPEEKTTSTYELDASHYPAWITVKSDKEVVLGVFDFTDGKLHLLFGNAKDRPAQLLSSVSAISLLLEKVPDAANPNSSANLRKPAAKVLADKVVIKSARTDRNQLLVDLEMNVLLTPSWLRSLYLGPDRPLTSADVQNRTHDYPLVSSVSDWPLNGNYQLSSGNQSQRFAFLFPSNEAASLALKQVDDLSRKGPQTLTATTALQLFRVEYDNKTYQGGIDIREGAAASTNLNAPVRLTLFVPYTFTLDDWKKFAAALEGPDVRILITQDAKGRNRPIQAALKIDPKYSSHDLRPITDALEKLGLPAPPKESTRKEPDHDHE